VYIIANGYKDRHTRAGGYPAIFSELKGSFFKILYRFCLGQTQPFRILKFGHWNLFDIWDLLFVIFAL